MIVVHPTQGLCNKLRVVFSYYQKALENNEELVVIWDITEQCNGYFLDYFEPIENITFVLNNDEGYQVDYRGYKWCKDYSPYAADHDKDIYQLLTPLPHLKKAIEERITQLEERYIAVHVRRTDHAVLAKRNKRYTADSEFHRFLNANDSYNLYLATDNYTTQDQYLQRYPERIQSLKLAGWGPRFSLRKSILKPLLNFFNPIQDSHKALRKTSLEDAINDLYVCIHADKFMGSGYSSFSNFIKYRRKFMTGKSESCTPA